MNNTFNLSRFGLLLKRQWQEFGKIYLISLFVMAGAIICLYAYNIPSKEHFYSSKGYVNLSFREPIFMGIGFLFITIVSSSYFAAMGQKSRATIELMLPGSVLEKFIMGVFFTAVLSTFSFWIIFYLTDMYFIQHLENAFKGIQAPLTDAGSGQLQLESAKFNPFFTEYSGPFTYPVYALPFAISSLFLLGSIYFNRFHYIKTAVSVMIFSGALSYFLYKISQFLIVGKVREFTGEDSQHISENQAMWLMTGALGLLALIFWCIGYMRLKEKEV